MVFSGLVGKSNYLKNIRSSKAEREHLVKFLLFINRYTEKVQTSSVVKSSFSSLVCILALMNFRLRENART